MKNCEKDHTMITVFRMLENQLPWALNFVLKKLTTKMIYPSLYSRLILSRELASFYITMTTNCI